MNIKQLIRRITTAAFAVAAALALPGATSAVNAPETPFDQVHPRVKQVMSVQKDVTPGLMSLPEILGTAVGQDDDGEVTMVVFVNEEHKNHKEAVSALPRSFHGVRVRVEVTPPFRAMPAKPDATPKVSHTAKQTPPIQFGTSGGWANDIANGYCCSGTLGSLVKVNGVQYILSNYHVLEGDGEPAGAPVIQPGLVDVGCNAGRAQAVATTSGIKSLPTSNVDAAIAQVVPGMVRTDGAILEIGTISSSTVAASINQAVKKSGRTTGLTRSKITGLNATVSVQYESSCAGSVAFTKTFTGQIIISNPRSSFLNSGDSGSLMVEDKTTNPRAVGLLYAGSSTTAIANPIDQVLLFFGATMVGQ